MLISSYMESVVKSMHNVYIWKKCMTQLKEMFVIWYA